MKDVDVYFRGNGGLGRRACGEVQGEWMEKQQYDPEHGKNE
jgi:hypothetical protein